MIHWQVRLSRRFNALTGGRPTEMFCSRCYRHRWKLRTFVINVIFLPIDGEWHHVRRAAAYERSLREQTRPERPHRPS